MEKANQTLIRAEAVDDEMVGSTMRGDPYEIIALLGEMVAQYLEEFPKNRKLMREVLRMAFRDTRPRLGDVLLEKLTKRGVEE